MWDLRALLPRSSAETFKIPVISMYARDWSFKETVLRIKSDHEQAIDAAVGAALQARRDIERTVDKFPEFRWSLEPLELAGSHPQVIDLMLAAG